MSIHLFLWRNTPGIRSRIPPQISTGIQLEISCLILPGIQFRDCSSKFREEFFLTFVMYRLIQNFLHGLLRYVKDLIRNFGGDSLRHFYRKFCETDLSEKKRRISDETPSKISEEILGILKELLELI